MTPSSSNPTVDHQAAAGNDRVGGNNKKLSNKNPEGAAVKEPPRRQNRSGEQHKKKNRSSNENPKRRRRNNPDPRPRRPLIPEARVVQAPSDCAFVSEEENGDQRDILEVLREERLLQESIKRHTRLFTPSTHPHFFVTVQRSNSFRFSDDEGEEL